jgi:hypothetical protein
MPGVIPVSAISVVAGVRNHRNRLASPRGGYRPIRVSSPLGRGPSDLIAWELGGNGSGNLLGKWETDWVSLGSALGRV